jgi:hypothetical protein
LHHLEVDLEWRLAANLVRLLDDGFALALLVDIEQRRARAEGTEKPPQAGSGPST